MSLVKPKQLKYTTRTVDNTKKKVLIYGLDGSGKSTFAAQYCKDHKLNPVIIDIDDTNFTEYPIIEIDTSSDEIFYQDLLQIIDNVKKNDEFDTIILDGMSTLAELLVGTGKGLSKYGERTNRWIKIRGKLLSGINLIMVGQIDFDIQRYKGSDETPNKIIIQTNSMVNEKYLCDYTLEKYSVKTVKIRELKK